MKEEIIMVNQKIIFKKSLHIRINIQIYNLSFNQMIKIKYKKLNNFILKF